MMSAAVSRSQDSDLHDGLRYAFGAHAEFEIDPSSYQLTHHGKSLALEPKAFDVLVYLIENRDRVVPNKELFAKFWPPHISATVLSHCIVITRKLLGDNSAEQQTIRTVRGRGYRFVANVVERPARASGRYELHAVATPIPPAPLPREALAAHATSPDTSPDTSREWNDAQLDAFVSIVQMLPHDVREAIISKLVHGR